VVRHEVIRRRLDRLAEYLNILERMRKYGRDEFLSDPEHFGSAERFSDPACRHRLFRIRVRGRSVPFPDCRTRLRTGI